jgi:hypothetical protein
MIGKGEGKRKIGYLFVITIVDVESESGRREPAVSTSRILAGEVSTVRVGVRERGRRGSVSDADL